MLSHLTSHLTITLGCETAKKEKKNNTKSSRQERLELSPRKPTASSKGLAPCKS
jgi:hypothetical protein